MSRYKYRRCPGCGNEYSLAEQTLCDRCVSDLKEVRVLRDREAKRAAASEEIVVRLGDDWMADGRIVRNTPRQPDHKIPMAMAALSGGLIYPIFSPFDRSVGTYGTGFNSSHSGMIWVGMTPAQADAAQALCDAFLEFCAELSANVEKRTNSFLVRIAEGDVSIKEINDASINVVAKR